MSKGTDLIMLAFLNLQQDRSVFREKFDDIGDKVHALKHYMTLNMGVTMQHSLDVGEIKGRLAALQQAP